MKKEQVGFMLDSMEELRAELGDKIDVLERRLDGLMRTLELLEGRVSTLR